MKYNILALPQEGTVLSNERILEALTVVTKTFKVLPPKDDTPITTVPRGKDLPKEVFENYKAQIKKYVDEADNDDVLIVVIGYGNRVEAAPLMEESTLIALSNIGGIEDNSASTTILALLRAVSAVCEKAVEAENIDPKIAFTLADMKVVH